MDNELLVKSIKNMCKENNISVSQLESELGFSPALISRWNKTSPSLDKIIDIADFFYVTLDEVVGRSNNGIDDEFLDALYKKTSDESIIWYEYDNENGDHPKEYHMDTPTPEDFFCDEDFLCFINEIKEKSYYSEFNNGYIVIYGSFFNYDIIHPNDLKLFIQPTDKAELIYQEYEINKLKRLWLKMLDNLGDSSPDIIKAENLKNEFILSIKEKIK